MEEKYLPNSEEQFFAVQLILRTKTEAGEEPDWQPQRSFMSDLLADFLHPECFGRNYVLTSSSGSIFCPSEQDRPLPLKIVEHNINGVPSIEKIKPVFYQHTEDGYTKPVEFEEVDDYEELEIENA